MESLQDIAAVGAQEIQLGFRLHAFRNDAAPQPVRHGDDRRHDAAAASIDLFYEGRSI